MAANEPKAEPKYALKVYDWRTDEWMLVDWYTKLVESGDMGVTFAPAMHYLGTFLHYWRGNVIMGYNADDRGIFFACWIEPYLSGGFFSVWIRSDKRHTVTALKLLTEAYNEAFKMCTVLIGLCKQEHLRDVHEKLGYKRLATVPGLWNGDAVDFYAMTKAEWEAHCGRKRR